jgi:long-chain acyl-CoA synthetase
MDAMNTFQTFLATAARSPSHDALRVRSDDGQWSGISWAQYEERVRQVARALMVMGVQRGGTVAILAPNGPQWLYAAVGAMAVGAAPAGVYPTSTAEQVAFVLRHARARVLFVTGDQLAKIEAHRADLPDLAHVVQLDGPSWQETLARGDELPEGALEERAAQVQGADVATLIYTSGTTGSPKAVQLTHDNLAFTQRTYRDALKHQSADDHLVSYLPLSHIAEQNLTLHGQIATGHTVWFCHRLELLPDVLREVRPSLFFAVPRVWERIEARLTEAVAGAPWLRRQIFGWAQRVGLASGRARLEGRPLPRRHALADRLVFQRLKQRLGLDRCRMLVSGAAKIRPQTLEFFLSLDLPIYEVYGMSENCAMTTLNLPGAAKLGTVGRPLPGVELRLAPDGEICVRGPNVFPGYLRDEAETADALDAQGWLHTGDVGELDADGFLRLTDRKKDLLKTSGGKFVAPAYVEGLLGTIPGVGQAALIGEGRKTCVALLGLDPEAAARVAESLGLAARDVRSLSADPAFRRHLQEHLDRVNAQLASYESVKAFEILPAPLTVDSGELTPTMKLKRKVVAERYAAMIEGMYAALG